VCCCRSLYAQDTAAVLLNPVTVSATLNPVQQLETGRNIVVITNAQLRNLPVNSIDELLRYLPGLEVQSRGPMGAQSDLSVRGSTYQQVLVILDGIRLNDPLTGHFSAYVPVTPAEIERVEILKGAASAIYGTEAVGGVVNIVTKAFAADGKKQSSFKAQSVLGEYGLFANDFGGAYSDGRLAIGGGVLSNQAIGQELRGARGYFNLRTASASVGYRLGNVQIAARSSYDDRDFAAQNFYTTFSFDTATEHVKSLWNQVRVSYRHNRNELQLHGGYKTTEDTYRFLPGYAPNENKMQLAQSLLTWGHRFTDNTNLTTGAQWIDRGIQSNDRGHHSVQQLAGFVILDQTFAKSFHAIPALRYDWNQNGGAEWVPQLSLSYNRDDFQLRGNVGKTTREPDFTERFNNFNKPLVIKGSLGNPDLKAEYSLSYELGADYLPGQALKISVTGFQRRYRKLIDWVPTPYSDMPYQHNLVDTGVYALATNIANVTTTGAELDLQFNRKLTDDFNLWFTTGFLVTDNVGDESTPAFYLTSQARFLANASISLTSSRFDLSLNGLYKQREPKEEANINAKVSDEYFVLNAKAEAFVVRNKLAVLAQVDNVLGERYSDLLGAQMPRRWLMAGLRLQL